MSYESIYERHLTQVIRGVIEERKDFAILHTSSEHEFVNKFLYQLDQCARGLYSRLFNRKGPWFLVDDVLKYPEAGSDSQEANKSLENLLVHGFIQTLDGLTCEALSSQNEWDVVFEAMDCFDVRDLRVLYATLSGGKKLVQTRNSLLKSLRQLVTSQKRIDGSRLPLAAEMQRYLRSKANNKSVATLVLFRINDAFTSLLHRIHRLYYLSPTSALSPTTKRQLDQNIGPMDPSTSGIGFIGSSHSSSTWPGLLEAFGKSKYAQYTMNHSRSLFPSHEHYLCLEVALELRCIMDRVYLSEIRRIKKTSDFQAPDIADLLMSTTTPPKLLAFSSLNDITCTILDSSIPLKDRKLLSEWKSIVYEDVENYICNYVDADQFIIEVMNCLKAFQLFDNFYSVYCESSSITPLFLQHLNAGWLLASILSEIIQLLERQKRYNSTLPILDLLLRSEYTKHRRGRWWNRKALNLEHLKSKEEALSVCIEGMKDPYVRGAHKITLERRLVRLSRHTIKKRNKCNDDDDFEDNIQSKKKKDINSTLMTGSSNLQLPDSVTITSVQGRPLNCTMGEKSRFIGYDDMSCSVEDLIIQHYEINGNWFGIHCEGAPLRTLFGIAMWDILFADIPDVFQSSYQVAPLDLFYADLFYLNRKDMIDGRFQMISKFSSKDLVKYIGDIWRKNKGTECCGVNWSTYSLKYLQCVAVSIGAQQLCKIFGVFCQDYKHFHGGLPDLLLLRVYVKEGSETQKDIMKWCDLSQNENFSPSDESDDDDDENVVTKRDSKRGVNGKNEELSQVDGKNMENIEYKDRENLEEMDNRPIIQNTIEDTDLDVTEDLIVQVRLIEVKGPRDILSDKQIAWLQHLTSSHIPVEVCHVVEKLKENIPS